MGVAFLGHTQTSLGCSELEVVFHKISAHPIYHTEFP